MTGTSNCLICNKTFRWYKSKHENPGKYCSRKCQGKHTHLWHDKNRFKWKNATEEEKIKHLSSIFFKRIIKPSNENDCWSWKGRPHNGGYAVMVYGSDHKQIGAHRVSWMIHKGEIPKGLFILHKCDNPICTNPEHLFLGTTKDNVQDMHKKGRANPKRNEAHHNAKLTQEKVKKIKKLLDLGVTMSRISNDFKISYGSLAAIKKGITWKNVLLN